jgi:hypothetical protein
VTLFVLRVVFEPVLATNFRQYSYPNHPSISDHYSNSASEGTLQLASEADKTLPCTPP